MEMDYLVGLLAENLDELGAVLPRDSGFAAKLLKKGIVVSSTDGYPKITNSFENFGLGGS
jgi:hypothetical protein